MAKVLLVDTNFSSAPIYDALCHLGHEVHVVGGNPSDCLAKLCEHYWQLDYSDIDGLKQLIDRESFEFLVPGCTDKSYTSCAVVSSGRFPGIESLRNDQFINNKLSFRSLARKLGLPIPQIQPHSEPDLRWPLVVKPVDSFSGKGITILHDANMGKLAAAVEFAIDSSSSKNFLIEDFVVGDLYSHSAFLVGGKISVDFFVQENCTANDFVVDTSRVIFSPKKELTEKIRGCIEILANEIDLKDGLIHTQFILQGNKFWLIETTRRCPGDLYSQLIELSTGFPYVDTYIQPFLQMPIMQGEFTKLRIPLMRHTVSTRSPQRLNYVRFLREIHIERWVPLSLTGDCIKASPATRVGILFAKAKTDEDLESIYSCAISRQLYEVI